MPKKTLPEPLVGWSATNGWDGVGRMEWLTVFREQHGIQSLRPVALCVLERLPRKGERVECRIVPAKKPRVATEIIRGLTGMRDDLKKAAKKKASHK